VAKLRSRSCIIDGKAAACGPDGMASFERIRYRRHDESVFMWAFDLIGFNDLQLMFKSGETGGRLWPYGLRHPVWPVI
jgi:hypothetical protein